MDRNQKAADFELLNLFAVAVAAEIVAVIDQVLVGKHSALKDPGKMTVQGRSVDKIVFEIDLDLGRQRLLTTVRFEMLHSSLAEDVALQIADQAYFERLVQVQGLPEEWLFLSVFLAKIHLLNPDFDLTD